MKIFDVQFVEDRNIWVIPVFTLDGFSVEKIIEHRAIDTRVYSRFGDFLKSLATSLTNLQGFPFPRWDYSIDSEYTVEEMVSIVMKVLNASVNIRVNDIDLFTKADQLPRTFRVARQIHEAILSRTKFSAVTMFNENYGFEVFGRVKSLSKGDEEYALLISVMRDESGKPKIYEYCSCPFHESTNNRFVCKHFLLAFAVFMKEILGSLDYLLGSSTDVSSHISRINNAIEDAIKNSKGYLTEGLVYYIIKYLINSGFIVKTMVDDKEKIINAIKWEHDNLHVDSSLIEKRDNVIVTKGTLVVQPVKKIVWSNEMNKMRINVMKLIYDLNKRFGLDNINDSDWSKMLAFAAIMSSDYVEPPTVIHTIGDVGTFKTTGARMISEYIEIPELVISYSGADAINKYGELIKIISNFFGIPLSSIENVIGGIITSMKILPNELKVSLNKTFLLSLAKRNKSDLDAFINELKDFKLEERIAKPKVSLLDPAQLSNIEDYRTKFIPSTIGLVTQYDIFDNHIIVVDEGSRNPRGLETLLTRMSISAINESVRIIIITDNLEPFTEVMSNPRYAPLHDRTFKTFTSTIKNELSILQHFNEKPSIKFNQTDLLIIKNFIDNIPVPEHILFLAKTIGYMLGYKFSIGIINETKYLQLFNREESPPVTIDVFKDIEFKFIPGGRFVHHTLSLAKFIAFLKGHDYVTIEDFKQAVATTIMSRTIIETKNYTEYKLSFIEIFNKIRELLKDNSIVEEVATLATALQNNDPQLENMFKTIMSKLPDKPFLAPAIASILEIQLTKGINSSFCLNSTPVFVT